MKLFLPLFLFNLLCLAESYKILVLYPLYMKSLNILGQGIVKHLLNDGHEVTFITTHPRDKLPSKKLRQIDISSNNIFKGYNYNFQEILENKIIKNSAEDMQELARENAKLTFHNKNITKLLEDPNEHFDAVIVDLFDLAVLYNCSMFWAYSMGAHWQVVRLIADPGNPSYDADYLGLNIPPFSFALRVEELWARIKWSFYKTFVTIPIERAIYEQTFGPLLTKKGRELPDYEEVIYNTSMIFANEHHAVISRPSTPQNFKYIGGFHIEDTVEPLPKDLQNLMDNAPHGVIYFSMGSFWQSKAIPIAITRGLLSMFGQLKQTVIWKYEDELKDLPKNVHIVKWAPQPSILRHPNCKIFISHGGILSMTESVHFGVPIIGIPIIFDQFINIRKAMANGYATKVQLNYDLPNNLKSAIDLMLTDETYMKKAKELSWIYHDAPTKPGAELAHWVRHVISTQGAPHLRSPAIHIPLYQRLYLDLAALIIGITTVLYLSLSLLMKKNNKISGKTKKH